jgi:hypothetical protein
MIYNIIVNAGPLPPDVGGWDQNITVEVEADSNPEFIHLMGRGWNTHYVLPGDDWCISAITDEVHRLVRAELEEQTLKDAAEIGSVLQEKLTEAYRPVPDDVSFERIGHIDMSGTFHPTHEFVMTVVREKIEAELAALQPSAISRNEWASWTAPVLDKIGEELDRIVKSLKSDA